MIVDSKSFSVTVAEILDDYSTDVREAVAEAVVQAGKKTLKVVRAKSPVGKYRGGGHYKKSWKMKKERGGIYHDTMRVKIYNDPDGPLVNLLEYGHQKSNGGRVEGIPHVGPAYDEADRILPRLTAQAIEEALKR